MHGEERECAEGRADESSWEKGTSCASSGSPREVRSLENHLGTSLLLVRFVGASALFVEQPAALSFKYVVVDVVILKL